MTKDLHLLSEFHLVECLAEGKFREALDSYRQKGANHWTATREQAAPNLIDQWVMNSAAAPEKTRMVFACTNRDVDMLHEALRQVRVERGEAHSFETKHGMSEARIGSKTIRLRPAS